MRSVTILPFASALLALFLASPAAAAVAAGAGAPAWAEPMRKVHAKFTGRPGTFAQWGDSITVTLAYWTPLLYGRKNLDEAGQAAFATVKAHMLEECWRKWKGPAYGSEGRMTIRWAHQNAAKWLKEHNPEVALIMFGTNDVGQVPLAEYRQKLTEVVDLCLANGTVVILSTIPPKSGRLKECREFAEAVRAVAKEKGLPLIDYFEECLKRRPDDWDGSAAKFKGPGGEYEVDTLISRDGVHPSNPRRWADDYSPEALRCSGYGLRSYLTLLKYAQVIDHAIK